MPFVTGSDINRIDFPEQVLLMVTTQVAASIGFISLGCAKNRVDSEVMAAHLTAAGFVLAPAPEAAEFVIVNTCAFIREAKEEAIAAILEACALKHKGPCRGVIVAGCLPQRYAREVARLLPEVDAFIGLDEVTQIGRIVGRLLGGERRVVTISSQARAVIEPPPRRLLFTGAPYAYLKIAEGCNHRCAFCAIPRIRGRYRSRPIKRIVAEAEALLARGIRELNLISQDVTAYGQDLPAGVDLPRLLRALGGIGGRFWIRLLYGHPGRVSDQLLDTITEIPQVCRYLDLPIQHCDAAILRAMGRGGDAATLCRLFQRIRRVLPDATLRTTCLVGFPGETRRQFLNLLEFLQEIQFDHVYAFAYSHEEETRAFGFPGQIPRTLAEARRRTLMRAQQMVVRRKNRALIGQLDTVLLEKAADRQPGGWIGRAARQAPEIDGIVRITGGAANWTPGDFVRVRYLTAAGYDLRAAPDGKVSTRNEPEFRSQNSE